MLFSENWLRELVNPKLSRDELISQLTMAGLEVEGFILAANEFDKVVVGQVVSVEKHPDADKLSVCQVKVSENDELLQIVCGASNVRVGLKVPLAMVGAQLAKDFKIKKSKLRDVESNGMLCAAEELGLADSSSGLLELSDDAPLGENIRSYLGLDDSIIEVDLTPNRGDCLSILGLAREVAVLNKLKINEVSVNAVKSTCQDVLKVELKSSQACPRYVGRIIKDINLKAETPIWLQEKLRRSGIRSIDPVVDVTNYILLEFGQPMHAFDLEKIEGGIQVRMASDGEKLKLLNEQVLVLRNDSLVIADSKKALALAGIMGGSESGVSDSTQNIFLESAFFSQLAVAGKARSYGLHTDSSHRFERGVDYCLQEKAMERATELLVSIVGGQVGPLIHVVDENTLPKVENIFLRKERLKKMLGLNIEDVQVENILKNLGLTLLVKSNGWEATVPSYRFDLSIEVDLIEEIGRIYGYNNLPVAPLNFPQRIIESTETQFKKADLLKSLVALSYQESICYSFIDESSQKLFDPQAELMTLQNPISAELSVMRSSLWPGLVKAAVFNQKRQQHALRLFEHGLVFKKTNGQLTQQAMVSGLVSASALPKSWHSSYRAIDFYDVKADVEAILHMGGGDCRFEACQHPALHPGQSAKIIKNGELLGYIGALHPQIAKSMDLAMDVFVFELDLALLLNNSIPKFKKISKYPGTSRDLALVVAKEVTAQSLLDAAYQVKADILQNISIFDIYEGANIGEGKKSIAINLFFQHSERTLEELEVTDFIDKMVKKLEQDFAAKLRD